MKLISALVGILCSTMVFSQSYYELKKTGNKYTETEITEVFSTANFCGSYFFSKRNVIEFDDGSIIELLSREEILKMGNQLPESCALKDDVVFAKSTWSISNGYIIRSGESHPTKESMIK